MLVSKVDSQPPLLFYCTSNFSLFLNSSSYLTHIYATPSHTISYHPYLLALFLSTFLVFQSHSKFRFISLKPYVVISYYVKEVTSVYRTLIKEQFVTAEYYLHISIKASK